MTYKSFRRPYKHPPVPLDLPGLPRYIDAELGRLEDALDRQFSENSMFGIDNDALGVPIENGAPQYQNLFLTTPTIIIDAPVGQWDATNGWWIAPYDGIFYLRCELRLSNIGTQGSGFVRVHQTIYQENAPNDDSTGVQDYPVGTVNVMFVNSWLRGFNAGDAVGFYVALTSTQTAQTADVVAEARVRRAY